MDICMRPIRVVHLDDTEHGARVPTVLTVTLMAIIVEFDRARSRFPFSFCPVLLQIETVSVLCQKKPYEKIMWRYELVYVTEYLRGFSFDHTAVHTNTRQLLSQILFSYTYRFNAGNTRSLHICMYILGMQQLA